MDTDKIDIGQIESAKISETFSPPSEEEEQAEKIKRSRKSKMKKRPQDWEDLKVEIAKELGLWPKVEQHGWSGLSAVESGRLGGIFSKRRKEQAQKEEE